jgi:hypothetical protein
MKIRLVVLLHQGPATLQDIARDDEQREESEQGGGVGNVESTEQGKC